MKGETSGLRQRHPNKTTKEILLLIIIMIIMNVQNKLYTT